MVECSVPSRYKRRYMYTQFFGLREKPFAITPDPQYLYLSYRHGEALAHLLYGVTESGGFIQLTGEVGTGKTLLTRSLLERLPADIDLALILNPRLSAQEFIEAIFDELHLPIPAGGSIKQLVDELNRHLLETHARGRRVVLLVDEAQNLDSDVLEQLRLLTNLETAKAKLLQIILVGQPELRQTLARNDLRQLAQRITGRYHLGNLTRPETEAYVNHRLGVAGAERRIFSRGAISELFKVTGGVPRLINIVCDRALLGAYTEEQPVVTPRLIRDAAAEIGGRPRPARLAMWWPEAGLAVGVVGLAAVALWFVTQSRDSQGFGNDGPTTAISEAHAATTARDQLQSLQRSFRMSRELGSSGAGPGPEAVVRGAGLDQVLAGAGNLTGTDAAMRALLKLWNVSLPDGDAPVCEAIRAQKLKCEHQVGSWTLLEQLNLPAILSLNAPGGETHQVVVAGLAGDLATLLVGDQLVEVPSQQVRDLWFGEALLIWQPNPVADSLMVPGNSGEGVTWLRSELERLQGGPPGDSEAYDATLADRVRRFQRDAGLEVDGIAGVHTLIALNNRVTQNDAPRLKDDR